MYEATHLYTTGGLLLLITFFCIIEPTQLDVDRFIEQNQKQFKAFVEENNK